ncbi:MAG: hypothetical protein H6765_02625 [Candidatus Peribacteria bacterium]|nr:MAG: hypothetical protein H6765_02625 [Candidatus Peribacteria bacterium]
MSAEITTGLVDGDTVTNTVALDTSFVEWNLDDNEASVQTMITEPLPTSYKA